MDAMFDQLRRLRARVEALDAGVRVALLVGGAAIAVALLVAALFASSPMGYAYVFTDLNAEDGTEAAATLKAAGVPFRLEAGGAAIAVPESRVHDARLLLAVTGIPRGGHVGFELFDRGDLGISQFTQRVNLRRAIEGELARTLSRLQGVRSARIHVTMQETALRRREDRPASAAVVLTLHPGAQLSTKELAGVRHLVAASVPGLGIDAVTVMDGSGAMLSGGDDDGDAAIARQKRVERELEERVIAVLQPLAGAGHVMARVTVELDAAAVDVTSVAFDPDSAVLRSEQTSTASNSTTSTPARGLVGAAANQPPVPGSAAGGTLGGSSQSSETRNYEISSTTTTTRRATPRIQRLSAAIVVDETAGKPRTAEEVKQMIELSRRALGADDSRGDRVEVQSHAFAAATSEVEAPRAEQPAWMIPAAAGAGAVVLLVVAWLVLRPRRRNQEPSLPLALLQPGRRVAEIEILNAEPAPPVKADDEKLRLERDSAALLERARELAKVNPQRAAMLLRSWMEREKEERDAA